MPIPVRFVFPEHPVVAVLKPGAVVFHASSGMPKIILRGRTVSCHKKTNDGFYAYMEDGEEFVFDSTNRFIEVEDTEVN